MPRNPEIQIIRVPDVTPPEAGIVLEQCCNNESSRAVRVAPSPKF